MWRQERQKRSEFLEQLFDIALMGLSLNVLSLLVYLSLLVTSHYVTKLLSY